MQVYVVTRGIAARQKARGDTKLYVKTDSWLTLVQPCSQNNLGSVISPLCEVRVIIPMMTMSGATPSWFGAV